MDHITMVSSDHIAVIAAPPRPTTTVRPQEDLMPRKRWNWLAIPAFLAAGAGIWLALTSTNTLAVIAVLGLALILSALSIRRIRRHEEAGKGFAVTALVLAVLASLLTIISIAILGF